jgi:hypothetical protein
MAGKSRMTPHKKSRIPEKPGARDATPPSAHLPERRPDSTGLLKKAKQLREYAQIE